MNKTAPGYGTSWLLQHVLVFLVSLIGSTSAFLAAFPSTNIRGDPILHHKSKHVLRSSTAANNEKVAVSYVDKLLSNNSAVLIDDEAILRDIQNLHAADYATAQASPLALEREEPQTCNDNRKAVNYEWKSNLVAVESLDSLFPQTDLQVIREAAEAVWTQQSLEESSSSRFTYQYEGNSEAHVSDFETVGKVGQEAVEVVNQMLTHKVYPWIRQVFFSEANDPCPSQLFVYDALVIRYNATAAITASAGQPLHRDLGLVSVNLMLNDGFSGGGTFFENQNDNKPLKPRSGPGNALAHHSYERHAGAGTVQGVRDILVMFISVREPLPRLMNARLKQTRDRCNTLQDPLQSILCRMQQQRLAVEAVPEDGEAFQYLGTTLLDYSGYLLEANQKQQQQQNSMDSTDALLQAIRCFQRAQQLTPNDARVYNNWSIALARLEERNQLDLASTILTSGDYKSTSSSPRQVYQRGLELLLQAKQAGCLVTNDLDSLSLNYGLYLANHDQFKEACDVLEGTASKFDGNGSSDDNDINSRVINDARGLWKFCKRQIQ